MEFRHYGYRLRGTLSLGITFQSWIGINHKRGYEISFTFLLFSYRIVFDDFKAIDYANASFAIHKPNNKYDEFTRMLKILSKYNVKLIGAEMINENEFFQHISTLKSNLKSTLVYIYKTNNSDQN